LSDDRLMKYFNFDEDDLSDNRRGVQSKKQVGRLRGERGSFKTKARIVGSVIGLASLVLLGIVMGIVLGSGVLNDSGILIFVIPLLFLMPLGVAGFLIFGKFADGNYSVKQVEGPIELGMTQTYNQDGTTNHHYRLQVGDQSFVAEPELSKIMTDGDSYRIYYADDWSEILSAEHV
jgi:hypothetical protein